MDIFSPPVRQGSAMAGQGAGPRRVPLSSAHWCPQVGGGEERGGGGGVN